MNRLTLSVVLQLIALGSGPLAASAQQLPPEANNPAVKAAQAACSADIQKFCPNVVPGEGRIVRCLVANAGQLSTPCRSSMLVAKSAIGR